MLRGRQPFGDTAVARTGPGAVLRLGIRTVLALGGSSRRIRVARGRGGRGFRGRRMGGGRRTRSWSCVRGSGRLVRGGLALRRLLHAAMPAARTATGGRRGSAILAGGGRPRRRRSGGRRGGRGCFGGGSFLDATVSAARAPPGGRGSRAVLAGSRSAGIRRVRGQTQYECHQGRRKKSDKICMFHGSTPPSVIRSPSIITN